MNRRDFLGASAVAALAASPKFFALESLAESSTSSYKSLFKPLDTFAEQYLRAMNAPGLTLVLADRDGVQRVVTYGFSDVQQKARVTPDQLFQIGSISKSFLANCLLQLHQEGKLDLQKPILDYLPWFRIDSAFAPVTVHHLLTHTSGLPGIPNVFLTDPAAKHRAAYAPGKLFHYNNTAFQLLGHLLMTLDRGLLPDIYRKRILDPLGMSQTEPVITLDARDRTAKNYSAFQNDHTFSRFGRLCEAPAIISSDGAGCIASTPHDMGLYVQMIARHGEGPKSRLLNEENFNLFSQAHIKADEFGPTASYGYGIAVDTLDGHKILRHTGGMISFASALQVDIDEGVGAFASINAMQGYRPNPVAQLAMQLMRAHRAKKSFPSAPEIKPATFIENASDFAGVYTSTDGHSLEFIAEPNRLSLKNKNQSIALESQGDGVFVAPHPDFSRFVLIFARANAKDPKSPVVELGWGSNWFVKPEYKGPKAFDTPKEWAAYLGHYRNENNWVGSVRITSRKGQLMADGATLLEQETGARFRMRSEEADTEWIEFHDIVDGLAQRIKLSGEDLWRVLAP
ncbi:MAG: beta-lactamase family protein [Acidobacteria bacterium]|nr:beta-lactamase family protein [Acidobacteriota bacterium]MBS1866988.1 beta-lactamase family protein [Acidobacteriota bacterium]